MIEIYRLLWILVLEIWSMNEEKLQFSNENDLKHDLIKEMSVFSGLKKIFASKLEAMSRNIEKKKVAAQFEKTLMKATEGTDLLQKIQNKIREDDFAESPSEKQDPKSPSNVKKFEGENNKNDKK